MVILCAGHHIKYNTLEINRNGVISLKNLHIEVKYLTTKLVDLRFNDEPLGSSCCDNFMISSDSLLDFWTKCWTASRYSDEWFYRDFLAQILTVPFYNRQVLL